jgi:hypothetical protein
VENPKSKPSEFGAERATKGRNTDVLGLPAEAEEPSPNILRTTMPAIHVHTPTASMATRSVMLVRKSWLWPLQTNTSLTRLGYVQSHWRAHFFWVLVLVTLHCLPIIAD